MNKILSLILASAIILLAACGGAETKVDTRDTVRENDTIEIKPETKPTETAPLPEPKSNSVDSPGTSNKNEILSNIDRHLVAAVNDAGNELTVENKVSTASFQRVLVEVSELKADGQPQKSNLYTLINIEPGDRKMTRITPVTPGAKLSIHVVKAKSSELTNGEMILVGSRYTPQ